jgi:pyruvate kinase
MLAQELDSLHIKIIATLGPSSASYEIMKGMAQSGVRIFRLNFSHAPPADFKPTIALIRRIEQDLDLPLTIMGDLSGPKLRIGEVADSPVEILPGQTIFLGLPESRHQQGEGIFISLDFPEILQGIAPGTLVSLSDGMLRFRVQEVLDKGSLFSLQAENGGLLSSNKGITFPGMTVPLSALTDKDIRYLHEALDLGFDAFALSFVQHKSDLEKIKAEIATHVPERVPVIAKLERAGALEHLDAILELADGIMVARGDLGLECPLEELPVTQKKIIRACRHAQKPVIVATQMLLSMVHNPLPTRAETTDVANAIYDGADCVMLSEETAVGQYPLEAVEFIRKIAEKAEAYYLERIGGPYPPKKEKNPGKYLAYSACLLAENTDSPALVSHSTTGITAAFLSSRRPVQPIYALTPVSSTIRLLNFYWGVRPVYADDSTPDHLERIEAFIQSSDLFEKGEQVVLTSGQPTPGQQTSHTNLIKIYYK